jgi:hypothetical protein
MEAKDGKNRPRMVESAHSGYQYLWGGGKGRLGVAPTAFGQRRLALMIYQTLDLLMHLSMKR